jgi:hypothetical protein
VPQLGQNHVMQALAGSLDQVLIRGQEARS